MSLSARLAVHPDGERLRLRLCTAFIEHRADLWPQGEPNATPDWIRAHVDEILGLLELAIGRHGQGVCRLPRRLHWALWLLADLGAHSTDDRGLQ
jgi:hypothetical protein